MVSAITAEDSVRDADVAAALKQLQDQVRASPSDPKLRVFLFQLLAVTGQWERALNQLDVAATLDVSALAMAQMYREALRCESLRADVFAGKRSPMVFGEPEQWLALLIESVLLSGRGQGVQAQKLRDTAFETAPASSGTIDGVAFDWIADADPRLGPVLEAIVNGRYYWIPFSRLSRVDIEEPADLRDFVWMPSHFQFSNGGEAVGLIPTRYPGSEVSADGAICLARKTVWEEASPGIFHGLGQRLLTIPDGEYPIMDIRTMVLAESATSADSVSG
ncbi:MAG: type VI secretion system accessory protein TagJ [Betaproteobacteria bacterium]